MGHRIGVDDRPDHAWPFLRHLTVAVRRGCNSRRSTRLVRRDAVRAANENKRRPHSAFADDRPKARDRCVFWRPRPLATSDPNADTGGGLSAPSDLERGRFRAGSYFKQQPVIDGYFQPSRLAIDDIAGPATADAVTTNA